MIIRSLACFLAFLTFVLPVHSWLVREEGSGNVMSGNLDYFEHHITLLEGGAFGAPNAYVYRWSHEGYSAGEIFLRWADDTDLEYAHEFKFQPLGISAPFRNWEADKFTSSNMHSEFSFGGYGQNDTEIVWEDHFYTTYDHSFFFVTANTSVWAECFYYSGRVTLEYEDSTETVYI